MSPFGRAGPHCAAFRLLFASSDNGPGRVPELWGIEAPTKGAAVTDVLLVAAAVLSHLAFGAVMFTVGWRRGACRRPAQRVRVELHGDHVDPALRRGEDRQALGQRRRRSELRHAGPARSGPHPRPASR